MELIHLQKLKGNQSGQAMVEYILLLLVVVGGFLVLSKGMERMGVTQVLTTPITQNFAMAYKYGHPKAKGFDEGTPENHPRISGAGGGNNFRMFINPRNK